MRRVAHRVHSHHPQREDLSVSLSSSSVSDRTVRSVGDRAGRPGEHRNSEAQIRTLLDNQKEQILAECQARINQHEFQAARAEEVQQRDQQLHQGQLLQQNLELREAHQKSLSEMEELKKFQTQSGTEFYCQWRKSHLMTSWKDGTNLEYESLKNSRPYWNCMTWRFIRRN